MKKSTYIYLVIIIALMTTLILFLPEIYDKIHSMENKKENNNIQVQVDTNGEKKQKEGIKINEQFLSSLTFPIMRNNKNSLESYYQLDTIDINNFSNNDILYNAFLDIYDGYLVSHSNVGCTTNSKEFDASYLSSRIRNIIGRDVKYTLEDFTVPNIAFDTEYIGMWKYNAEDNKYIFYGNCHNEDNNTIYYDVKKLQKGETSENNTYVYLDYAVYFVKVEGNQYSVYKDANMTNLLLTGVLNGEDITSINVDSNQLKKYRFTFKKGICTYDNYCFYKGEWLND